MKVMGAGGRRGVTSGRASESGGRNQMPRANS